MKRVHEIVIRWRIMIGLNTNAIGEKIDPVRARADAYIIASGGLDAFNVTDGEGLWAGRAERSLVIEHIGPLYDADAVRVVAETLVAMLDQAEIWVTAEEVSLHRYIK